MSGGDEEFVRDIISTFLETARNLVDAVVDAGANNDADKGVYAAHTLKGSARSVGAAPLGDLCEELEKLARAKDMAAFADLSTRVPEGFALLKNELEVVLTPKAA